MFLSEELKCAKQAAIKMGKLQLDNFRRDIKVVRKSAKDLVSNIDMECQRVAKKMLSESFEYDVVSEEKRFEEKIESNLFWIIDPVDGTHNYISGLPNFGVSIALASMDEFLLGVIYLPFFEEMYFATKSSGSYMNDEKIHVSSNNDFEKSLLTYDNQFHLSEETLSIFKKIVNKPFTTRILGSAVYDFSLIASGRIDARICNNAKIFDIAAGISIIEEAGGKVTDFE